MKILITLLFIMASTFSHTPIKIEDLQWKKRVLLIFPSNKNTMELGLTSLIKENLSERDLVYFYFGNQLLSNSNYTFSKVYQKELKNLYNADAKKGNYILIGKDGSPKLNETGDEINWQLLFSTIDSMPMRIQEMKKKPN